MHTLFVLAMAFVISALSETPSSKYYVIWSKDAGGVASIQAAEAQAEVSGMGQTPQNLQNYNGFRSTLTKAQLKKLQKKYPRLLIEEDPLAFTQADSTDAQTCETVDVPATFCEPYQVGYQDKNTHADQAWMVTEGLGQTVAVLDTGITRAHPGLKDNIVGCASMVSGETCDDGNGHGTHCAGIVAGHTYTVGTTKCGMPGVAPKAKIYAIKVLNNQGTGPYSVIADGIKEAQRLGLRIISMSLGGPTDSQIMQDAVTAFKATGGIIVCAAGNTGGAVIYPGKYCSIAVAASDVNNITAGFSSRGPEVDIIAPGVNIRSTCNDGKYCEKSGTSMATPVVAGAVAEMMAANVKQKLCGTPVGLPVEQQGYGLLDVYKSVKQ